MQTDCTCYSYIYIYDICCCPPYLFQFAELLCWNSCILYIALFPECLAASLAYQWLANSYSASLWCCVSWRAKQTILTSRQYTALKKPSSCELKVRIRLDSVLQGWLSPLPWDSKQKGCKSCPSLSSPTSERYWTVISIRHIRRNQISQNCLGCWPFGRGLWLWRHGGQWSKQLQNVRIDDISSHVNMF